MNNPSPFELSGPLRTAFALLVALAGIALLPSKALAQANPNPPSRLTYQGFLVGSDGVALGNTAPKNYDVIFTIFNSEVGSGPANKLWAEQQTVTVDKGYFNVLLGEGAAVPGVAHSDLSELFKGADASDRFVGTTVKGIGANGSNVDITPRLRLLSSPYSLLSRSALKLVGNTGADLVSATDNQVTVAGNLNVTGTFTAGGAIPIGGIIMWSGSVTNIPAGWALCNGQTVNGRATPDLRDRFVVGAGSTYAAGATGGNASITLSVAQLPPHNHSFSDAYLSFGSAIQSGLAYVQNPLGGIGAPYTFQSTTAATGSGAAIDIRPLYYSLGYIMRVQ
jgi:microcystin-dependent protein